MENKLTFRYAVRKDIPLILQFIRDLAEYEKLLDEYDKEIELLENKADKTDGENKYLQELLLKERKLIQLIPENEDET